VQSWYEVLEDTLLGRFLDSFDTSVRRQVRKAPKFYLFDTGVTRSLSGWLNVPVQPETSYYGEIFEQFIVNQLFSLNSYLHLDLKLSYLRTKSDAEIDLVIQRPGKAIALVEIKSRSSVSEIDTHGLKRFEKDFPDADFFLVSPDPVSKVYGKVNCLYFKTFFELVSNF
jgi:predicted AAA+ superfamily ATPase